MRKIKVGIIGFLLQFCFLLQLLVAGHASANTVRVVYTDWCPYMCANEQGDVGYAVEVVRLVFADSDINISMVQQPYHKALQMLKAGDADLIPAMFEYDLHDISTVPSKIGELENQYFILSGTDWYYTNPVSLERLSKLGLLGGQRYEPMVELYKRKNRDNVITLEKSKGTPGLINLLLEGKVAAILQDKNAVNYYRADMPGAADVKLVGTMRNPQTLVTGFSDKMVNQEKIMAMYQQGLESLREEGKLQVLLAKYHVADWQ